MVTFKFHNQQRTDVELVIEPWAQVERVEPGSQLEFDVNDSPPAEVEFAVTEEGHPYVYVMSERVVIRKGDVVKHEFTTKHRPPSDVFRILNKHLFARRD